MRWAAMLLLLAACDRPASPTVGLKPDDLAELERMQAIWMAHGLPDPGQCAADAEIVWPASDEDIRRWCQTRPCGPPEARETTNCADGCFTSRRDGLAGRVPMYVVSRHMPRDAWRHEALHHWERCLGLSLGEDVVRQITSEVEKDAG